MEHKSTASTLSTPSTRAPEFINKQLYIKVFLYFKCNVHYISLVLSVIFTVDSALLYPVALLFINKTSSV